MQNNDDRIKVGQQHGWTPFEPYLVQPLSTEGREPQDYLYPPGLREQSVSDQSQTDTETSQKFFHNCIMAAIYPESILESKNAFLNESSPFSSQLSLSPNSKGTPSSDVINPLSYLGRPSILGNSVSSGHQRPGNCKLDSSSASSMDPEQKTTTFSSVPGARPCYQGKSSKSLLDDDWILERVEQDRDLANVAEGLIKAINLNATLIKQQQQGTPRRRDSRFSSCSEEENLPSPPDSNKAAHKEVLQSGHVPDDYICRLCLVPGHWMQDCRLFEPKTPTRTSLFRREVTVLSKRGEAKPPASYVCRLCHFSGHWIENCEKFEKHQSPFRNPSTQPPPPPLRGKSGSITIPPKGYICNLCLEPGHWIQDCSDFVPMSSNSSRSSKGRSYQAFQNQQRQWTRRFS